MDYNIVLTTAEDIVAVVDAVVARGSGAKKQYIREFTGIATEEQVNKAIEMAIQLQFLKHDTTNDCYETDSFLAKKLVSVASDDQKAVFMRLALEQYVPYNTFKTRYQFTKVIEIAISQTKVLHSITSNERDIKSTLISIATYAKALKSEGANLYSFREEEFTHSLIEDALEQACITNSDLCTFFGEPLCDFINNVNVFHPLSQAIQKTKDKPLDTKSIIVHSANAFESFLNDIASYYGVSLSGRAGILQKRDALSRHISKKHRGMIEYIGQIRNASDHGGDTDEGGQTWMVSPETAMLFPSVVAITIKDIYRRCFNNIIEV